MKHLLFAATLAILDGNLTPNLLSAQPLPAVAGINSQSFLGIGLADVDKVRTQEMKLPGEYGAIVTLVYDGSPAEKAGLKLNDVVVQYNGQRVEGQSQLRRYLAETPPGRKVTLQLYRNGQAKELSIVLGRRQDFAPPATEFPTVSGLRELPTPPTPPRAIARPISSMGDRMLGIEGEQLNPQMATFFGVKGGVLVRQVGDQSVAFKSGLKAGDVITKVDGTPVTSFVDVVRAVRSDNNRSVSFTVVREKREMSITATWKDEDLGPMVPRAREIRKWLGSDASDDQ
jgi:serine protease Do